MIIPTVGIYVQGRRRAITSLDPRSEGHCSCISQLRNNQASGIEGTTRKRVVAVSSLDWSVLHILLSPSLPPMAPIAEALPEVESSLSHMVISQPEPETVRNLESQWVTCVI